MTKIYFVVLVSLLLAACSKNESASTCLTDMRNHFRKQLNCQDPGKMETHLYRGVYEGKVVYFFNTMCINCNVIPPQRGYTCAMEEVSFSDFQDVTDVQQVYNSCTGQFSE